MLVSCPNHGDDQNGTRCRTKRDYGNMPWQTPSECYVSLLYLVRFVTPWASDTKSCLYRTNLASNRWGQLTYTLLPKIWWAILVTSWFSVLSFNFRIMLSSRLGDSKTFTFANWSPPWKWKYTFIYKNNYNLLQCIVPTFVWSAT